MQRSAIPSPNPSELLPEAGCECNARPRPSSQTTLPSEVASIKPSVPGSAIPSPSESLTGVDSKLSSTIKWSASFHIATALLASLDKLAYTTGRVEMEEQFCSAALNFDFGSVTNELLVIKAVYSTFLVEAEHRSMQRQAGRRLGLLFNIALN